MTYDTWSYPYDGKEEREHTYQFMIFKQSTLSNHTIEEIIENDIYDKLYILTYDELEAMNFVITYTDEETE